MEPGTECAQLSAQLRGGPAAGGAAEALRPYVAFNAELRTAFQRFVGRLEAQCRELARARAARRSPPPQPSQAGGLSLCLLPRAAGRPRPSRTSGRAACKPALGCSCSVLYQRALPSRVAQAERSLSP